MLRSDIVVIGAGSSGLCAAIAAGREGKQVLLVERAMTIGGTNTLSLVGPLMGFTAGGRPVVKGIAQEMVDRLMQRGGTLGHIPDPLGVTDSITPIDPEILKQVDYELLRETPGVELLLGTTVMSAKTLNGRIEYLMAYNKTGLLEIRGDVFIDATGDGDVAAAAGVPFTMGRAADGLTQPMTEMFRIRGVDFRKVRAYMSAHPEQFILAPDAEEMPYTAVSGYFDMVARAQVEGKLQLQRDRVLLFQGVRPDEAIVNMSRVIRRNGTNAQEITAAEVEGRRQVDEIVAFLRDFIDGFQDITLVETGVAIGVRESRHVHGLYCLTEEDVLSSRSFPDAVAVCAFPIDIHDPNGQELHWTRTDTANCYDVPYRVMVPREMRNLLVTGRCVSATHEAAASVRITPTAMALGQAAGLAAVQALEKGTDMADLDVEALRVRLREVGAIPGKNG